ncbi:BTAD domain-containing putative transcriptional regulator [Streptomyces yanii]|uniref:BTAD domain-containing putative transcriptional regulator n=1 Tax=Streptomyces yanii TaxID=78510 RepID=A0ABV5RIA9_9ACTN
MVTELTDLVAAHPVRERLVAALMRALVAVRELTAGAGPGPAPRPPAMQIACEGVLGRRRTCRRPPGLRPPHHAQRRRRNDRLRRPAQRLRLTGPPTQ